MAIFESILQQKSQNLPFVAYRKPNENQVNAILQNDNSVYEIVDFSECGFVFCSFDGQKNIVFLEEKCQKIQQEIFFEPNEFSLNERIKNDNSGKNNHISLVKNAISKIETSECTKIVVSRKETIEIEVDAIHLFKKLLFFNPNAFTYIWFHPKIGLWMGAFGEQLLKINRNTLQTMSLAGTQKIFKNQATVWQEKEIQEQQIVTNFIVNELQNTAKAIKVSDTKTIISGNIAHLKSDITAGLPQNFNLKNIINALHPTPAVCGFPKTEAKKFIIENENYQREFYAGFVGEINFGVKQTQTNLFVNLRCLKINQKSIDVFVGGGITKDSNSESEWEETVNKSMAIKSLL